MKRTRKSRDDPIVQDGKRIGNPSKRSGATAPDLSKRKPAGPMGKAGVRRTSAAGTNEGRHETAREPRRSDSGPPTAAADRRKDSQGEGSGRDASMDTTNIPQRIARRPNPSQWGLDELLTLEEAAALHWPQGQGQGQGPLTARSLRTAADAGALGTVLIARKKFTTRRQIAEMSRCERTAAARRPPATVGERCPDIGMTLEEARTSGTGLRRLAK